MGKHDVCVVVSSSGCRRPLASTSWTLWTANACGRGTRLQNEGVAGVSVHFIDRRTASASRPGVPGQPGEARPVLPATIHTMTLATGLAAPLPWGCLCRWQGAVDVSGCKSALVALLLAFVATSPQGHRSTFTAPEAQHQHQHQHPTALSTHSPSAVPSRPPACVLQPGRAQRHTRESSITTPLALCRERSATAGAGPR